VGKVYLVGAGPGDPDLLTVKAARLLCSASVVFHDSLVSREVLRLTSRDAKIVDVGKRCGQKLLTQSEINTLLVSAAHDCEIVVRLKGGDPLIFGRAGEEIEALLQASVDFEIVPGITAALGAAAAAKISLTDRRAASQIVFSTFSRSDAGAALDWGCITSATTLAIYMPGPDYAEVARRLLDAGQPEDLPCVIVSNATSAKQEIRWSTVGELHLDQRLPAPALLIVGRVAKRQMREVGVQFWRNEWKREASRNPVIG
jgi:uroporphyrin-III C-methyltransferase